MAGLCTVEGCDKKHFGKGWCQMHYLRWKRHGDSLKRARPASGEVQRYYREVVLAYDGDDCLLWPYYRNSRGYAEINNDGSSIASRLVCEEANGLPPTPEHEAAHSCGKGHLGCVTKRHLSWKTHAENQADRIIHGTSGRGEKQHLAKLTERDVHQVRGLLGHLPKTEIAAKFGVSATAIGHIARGSTWGWLA